MLSVGFLIFLGAIGLGLLALFLIFDDVFDLFHGEPILPGSAMFAATFGFSGAIALTIKPDSSAVLLLVPLGIALVLTLGFFIAYRSFRKVAEADEKFIPDPQSMVGSSAVVNWWTEGRGEIVVSYLGARRKMTATSDEPLKATQTVYISKVLADRHVEVSTLTPERTES